MDSEIDAAFGGGDAPKGAPAVISDPEISSAFASEVPQPKVKSREITEGPIGFINGLAEIAGKGIGNMPMGAVHGAYDLASRATGFGPKPSEPTFPLSANAESVAQSVGGEVSRAAEPYRVRAAEPFLNKYVAPVLGDVAAIAPVAGVGKALLGRAAGAELTASGAPAAAQAVVDKATETQSMGAAGAAANVSHASPELQMAIARADPTKINLDALKNHFEADQHGIQLTKGQATRDPAQFSNEQNTTHPDVVARIEKQNGQMVDALDTIRRNASPTSVHADPIENGQNVVDALKAHDEPIQADIQAKYKALTDANGGAVPLDTGTFLQNVDKTLKKQYLTTSLPPAAQQLLEGIRAGEPLDFEGFEAARSRLAEAQRMGGSAGAAARIVRGELEQLPLSPAAAQLKGLADTARSAAKARFSALESDPAYQAAVDDAASGVKKGEPSALADRFLDKYALGTAPKANVERLMSKLDPEAQGAVASHTLSAIRKSAVNANGGMLPNGYNGALQKYGPKLDALVAPETKDSLESLGRVITNAKVAPPGHFVNYSKSGVIVNAAQGLGETALNAKTMGLGVPLIKNAMKGRFAKDALKPGAGIERD